MTKFYFSKSELGFYISDMHENIPKDSVEITKQRRDELLYGANMEGKRIIADENGYPILTDPIHIPKTSEENKIKANKLLITTDWVTLADVIDTRFDPHLLNQIEFLEYRSALRSILTNPLDGDLEWPILPKAQWSS